MDKPYGTRKQNAIGTLDRRHEGQQCKEKKKKEKMVSKMTKEYSGIKKITCRNASRSMVDITDFSKRSVDISQGDWEKKRKTHNRHRITCRKAEAMYSSTERNQRITSLNGHGPGPHPPHQEEEFHGQSPRKRK